jgi:hypothetical protein
MVSEMNNNPHYVTPKEAENKICPYYGMDNCISKDCMAWRWAKIYIENDKERSLGYPGQAVTTYSTTHGRCGKVLI